jgi:DNA repair protein RadC
MKLKEENLHAGHRERMREKFRTYGRAVMHSHELLEMLLFHVVSYRNTNPIARRLMLRFSTLDGVFSATREELLDVEGVGPKIADFLLSVGKINLFDAKEEFADIQKSSFGSYNDVGEYFVDYFKESRAYEVVLLLLNGKMEFLDLVSMSDSDYDSAAVRVEPFISEAIRVNASVVIVAHHHPYGPLFPKPGDKATNHMIFDAFSNAGISLVEHYVVSGGKFVGIMHNLAAAFSQPSPFCDFHGISDGACQNSDVSEENEL